MKFRLCALGGFLLLVLAAGAQTTTFTYQGQLNSNGVPATGSYDLRFQIYNANNSVVAGPLTNAPVGVTNGLFITTLDFGANIFDGSSRSLEIGVRTNGGTNAYVVLSPRQALTSVPYAIQALNAATAGVLTAPLPATNMVGTIPNSLLSTNVAFLTNNNAIFLGSVTATNFIGNGFGLSNVPGTSLIGIITGNGSGLSNVPGTSLTGIITGNGSGLTNVPATSLTGTLPDARLSANVALYNANASFSNGVTAAIFTGAGHGLTNVPGAFFWITNAVASYQMLPNIGYIATNNTAPVVFTLPLSPIAGDVYKVAGVGAGGWIIAQNTNQMIAAGNLSSSVGQSWKAGASALNWSAIASSSDGTKLVATVNNGYIYTSTNSGATWTLHNSSPINTAMRWSSVASSSDGTKLVAAVGYTAYYTSGSGQIYTSTDSGASWTARASSLPWSSVASSADGTKLVAAVYGAAAGAGAYTSADSGGTWTLQAGASYCSAVASSANGSNLVATFSSGASQGIYTSTNSGVGVSSWLLRTNSGGWTDVASSADGSRLVATSGGQIYVSTDSGATWVAQTSPVTGQITSVASSSDGSRLAVAVGGSGVTGSIYASSASGATWTQLVGAPTASWSAIASSADGSQLAAAVYGGNIYVSSQSSTTAGTAGYLIGPQHSAIELIYAGNNLFLPLSHEGTIRAH